MYIKSKPTLTSKLFSKVINYPYSVTICTTVKCNSRCKTCNRWKVDTDDEITLSEYSKLFDSMGHVFWATIGGGEPFLRDDFDKIVEEFIVKCEPRFVNIPTNGTLPDVTEKSIRSILEKTKDTRLIVNVSYDGYKENHDSLRGFDGNYELLKDCINRLKGIKDDRFVVGVNTILSKYNLNEYSKIYEDVLDNLKPDSYIIEIAQNRREFFNDSESYIEKSEVMVKALEDYIRLLDNMDDMSTIVKKFRKFYCRKLIKEIKNDILKEIKCYAGVNSCYIDSQGKVWACAVADQSLGNVYDFDLNFDKLWDSVQARNIRYREEFPECESCNISNSMYFNLPFNFSEFTKGLLR